MGIEVRRLELDGLVELRPQRFGDERGFFSEVWSRSSLSDAGFDLDFVQDNHSYSASKGVLRGIHYQLEPAAQDKLVRVTRGAVFDVAVDIRPRSATFGRWLGLTLSSDMWNQLLIPRGFAHGFVTLVEDCEVQYKVTEPYRADLDRCIRFDDPEIGIDWPTIEGGYQLSAKDRVAPALAEAMKEIG